ncbi:O-antigen ligase family protein [Limosilactobacillus reuteri]
MDIPSGKKTLSIFTIILLIVNYKFFYLFALPGTFGQVNNELIYTFFSLIFFGITLIVSKKHNLFLFNNFIILLFVFLFFEAIFTIFTYQEPSSSSFKEIIPFLSLFSYYVFSSLCQIDLDESLKIFIIVSTIAIIVAITELILYTFLGLSIFKFYGFNYGIQSDQFSQLFNNIRNGRQRLFISNLVDFSAVISIGCLFDRDVKISKFLLISNIVLIIFYEFYVSQTRSMIIYILIIGILVFVFSRKGFSRIGGITVLIFGAAFAILEVYNKFLSLMLGDYSYYHRLEEFSFYIDRFKANPIFGIGLLGNKPIFVEDYYLVHGPEINSPMSYTDVGVVGMLGKYGFFGLIFSIYLPLKTWKLNCKYSSVLLMSIFFFFCFSLINLSLFDSERLPVLAVSIAIIDGIVKKESRIKVERKKDAN